MEEVKVRCHYVQNIESQLNFGSNENVSAASLLNFYDNNIEEYEKQGIVTNLKFEYIITSIKKHFFHQRMVNFVNKLELSDHEY